MADKNYPVRKSGEPMAGLVIADKKDFKRPNCPDCGSSYVRSHGESWNCRDCGRRWQKVRRQCDKCPYKK